MSVYTNPPEWEAQGKKPPSSKRTEGWKPGDRVPASWLNWFWFSTVNSLREIAQAFVSHRDSTSGVHGVPEGETIATKRYVDGRVDGLADELDAHIADKNNPHGVTAEQIGAAPAHAAIPVGGIIMWSGSIDQIPEGWALCDGRTYRAPDGRLVTTPDLRDRFIVGAGLSYQVGERGGAAQVTLTVAQIPPHTHTYLRPEYSSRWGPLRGSGYVFASANQTTGSTGGGQPHENRPPYYALCFIMKL